MPAPLPLESIVISGERTVGSFAEFAQSDNLDGRLTKLRHRQDCRGKWLLLAWQKDVALKFDQKIGARSGI